MLIKRKKKKKHRQKKKKATVEPFFLPTPSPSQSTVYHFSKAGKCIRPGNP